MPIQLNTIEELKAIGEGTLKTSIPSIDGSIPGNFANTLLTGTATQVFTEQKNIEELQNDFFPQTGAGEFLDFWGEIEGLTRGQGSVASGNMSIEAVPFTGVPIGTTFASGSNIYESTAAAFSGFNAGSVTLTFSGGIVTAVTGVAHTLVNNFSVTISGASDSDYNGTFVIIVIDEFTFTYAIVGTPAAPDSGSYVSFEAFINLPIQSVEIGADQNLPLNSTLVIQTPVVSAASFGLANGDGITAGADAEDDESFRERILLSLASDKGVFTSPQIRLNGLSVLTATRIFIQNPEFTFTTDGTDITNRAVDGATFSAPTVTLDMTAEGTDGIFVNSVVEVAGAVESEYNGEQTITGVTATSLTYDIVGTPTTPATGTIDISLNRLLNIPVPGYVFVFVLDDNNDPPTASSATLDAVKEAVLVQLPAHTPEDAVVVDNLIFESVAVTITSLDPFTPTMEDSIKANLATFFEDNGSFKDDVKRNELIAAIQNSVDSSTGDVVENFNLTVPAADVSIGNGKIGILGTVLVS